MRRHPYLFLLFCLGVGGAQAAEVLTEAQVAPECRASNDDDERRTMAALEAKGLPIGRVEIRLQQVFDEANPDENNWFYRWVNRAHRNTDPQVISNDLLLREGAPFTRQAFEESSRILRSRSYLRHARIIIVGRCDEAVNIEVRAREVWTLEPELSYSHKGGASRTRFGIKDKNFLGSGTTLKLSRENDVDRQSSEISFRDNNFTDLRFVLDVEYASTSDGSAYQFELYRPFYALDTTSAGGVHDEFYDRIDAVYEDGRIVDHFAHRHESHTIEYGWSNGVIDGSVTRWSWSLNSVSDKFSAADNFTGQVVIPRDREFRYPALKYSFIQDHFTRTAYFDNMGVIEDWHTGLALTVSLGLSSRQFGANDNALVFGFRVANNHLFGDGLLLRWQTDLNGYWQDQTIADTKLAADLGVYLKQSSFSQLFIGLHAEGGKDLPLDHWLYLGGDNGLRGYPLRYQAGNKMLLFNLEQRFFWPMNG